MDDKFGVVCRLKELLEEAQAGRITGFACAYARTDGSEVAERFGDFSSDGVCSAQDKLNKMYTGRMLLSVA